MADDDDQDDDDDKQPCVVEGCEKEAEEMKWGTR